MGNFATFPLLRWWKVHASVYTAGDPLTLYPTYSHQALHAAK